MEKIFIVVNDFRSLPFSAALNIYRMYSKKYECLIIISDRFFSNSDFGSVLPFFYKKIKYLLYSLFFDIKIISSNNNTLVKKYHYTGLDSSLKSITLDSLASEEKYPKLFENLLQICKGAIEICDFIETQNNIKFLALFNGRGAPQFPISHFCFYNQIKIMYYEYSELNNMYYFSPNPPHALIARGNDLVKMRRNSINRIHSMFENSFDMIKLQLSNKFTLQYKYKSPRPYEVVVFMGSDHEYTGLDPEIAGYSHKGNLNLVKYAYEKYNKIGKICVRAHPNQCEDVSHEIILEPIISYCRNKDIDFYSPDSNISSYDLINNSNIVIVEYSSIAYDSFFMNSKVDIYGDSDLKVFLKHYSPKSNPLELKRIIAESIFLKPNLHAVELSNLLKISNIFFKFLERRLFVTSSIPKLK